MTNDYNKRADKYSVENGGEIRRDGTPVLVSAPNGQVVEKNVEHYTIECPECGSVGRTKEKGEIICEDPECAVVISDDPPLAYEEYNQQTHNEAATMGASIGGKSESKAAPRPDAGTASSGEAESV